jgi:hypothetical protein
MARIALIAGCIAAGIAISVMTGGLGTFAVGAWTADIIAGASVGAAAGSVLSSVIFPPHSNAGPPMNDLQAMSSAAGAPIPWGYGGYRIAGQVIWADTIKVTKNQESTGGGKGGGPTTTVYTYTIDAAISFGFGPGTITRIWADSKLIYDTTGKGPIAIDTGLSQSNGMAITTPFSPTIYEGSATQLPDPTIQANQGIDSTSGYRDQIYMVITNFPLADYGNRLPNFRAEVTSNTGLDYVADFYPASYIPSYGNYPAQYPPYWAYVDSYNRFGWMWNTVGTVVQKIDLDLTTGTPADPYALHTSYNAGDQVLDSNGNIQLCNVGPFTTGGSFPAWQTGFGQYTSDGGNGIRWINMGPGPDVVPIVLQGQLKWNNNNTYPGVLLCDGYVGMNAGCDSSGNLWAQLEVDSNSKGYSPPSAMYNTGAGVAFGRFNPDTLKNDVLAPTWNNPPFVFETFTRVKSANTGKDYLYCAGGASGWGVGMAVIDATNGNVVVPPTNIQPISTLPTGTNIASNGLCPLAVNPQNGTCYMLINMAGQSTPGYGAAILEIEVTSGSCQVANTLYITDFSWQTSPGADDLNTAGLWWDQNDNTLIFATGAGILVKVDPKTGNILAKSQNNALIHGGNAATMSAKATDSLVPTDGVIKTFGYTENVHFNTTSINWIRASDLSIIQSVPVSNWIPGTNSYPVSFAYDALSNSMLCAQWLNQASCRIYLDRQQVAEESLANVITDIWTRCGADPSLLDTTQVAGIQVKGYPVTSQTSGKGILGPLMAAFFFDMVETDNKLVCVPRGQSVTTVIPETDMGIEKDQYEANPTIIQEHDLPLVIDVDYYDIALDYQQGKQTYRRHKSVKKTRNRTSISLPLSMQAIDAVAIASRALQTAWAERNMWEYKLWKSIYLTLDPTDVVQFTYKGAIYQSRLTKTAVGQDRTIEISAVSEDPRQYASSPTAGASLGFQSGTITALGQTVLFTMDMPLIYDGDTATTGNFGFYWATGPASNASSWPGANMLESLDNNTFTQAGTSTVAATYGYVLNPTPLPPTTWTWDNVTVINVVLKNGRTLNSDSMIDVLNGSNWFALGGGSNGGNFEICGFTTAILQADGSYNISGLLRGLRGTEVWSGTHQSNEYFILLDSAIQRNFETTSDLGVQQYLRSVTFGLPTTGVASVPVTLVGNDLKPYAPCQIAGARS